MSDETEKSTPAANEIAAVPPSRKEARPWKAGESGNVAGRTSGAAKIAHLLDPHKEELIAKCVSAAKAGDMAAMRLVMERIAAPLRAESPRVLIPGLAEAATLADKSNVIVAAMGNGLISPDSVAQLLSVLADAAKIHEVDVLRRELDEIKAQLTLRTV